MEDIVHCEFYERLFVRPECLRLFEGFPEAQWHNVAADQHLVAVRTDINQLYDDIGVCGADSDIQADFHWSAYYHAALHLWSSESQHILSSGCEFLVCSHIVFVDVRRRTGGGNWLERI